MFAINLSIVRATITAIAIAGLGVAASPATAKTGTNGWQTPSSLTVPTGLGDQFVHIACPKGFSVQNGAFFAANGAAIGNGFTLTGQGPRLDLNPPEYGEWAWNFIWPNGGAPAGTQLIFNVLCKKGAA